MSTDFLPVSRKDMEERGIEQLDFVYVIGDAYVDHPSFGHAIISRLLEAHGFRVGIISQPDWKDEKSISILGKPRLGFLVSAGNMDSMVNHYTVSRKRRQKDAYTPGGVMGKRPDNATIVYCNLIRRTYKHTPIIIGGIEASLRRLAHYDYWSDSLKRSILLDSGADLISYGMGEHSIIEIAEALEEGIELNCGWGPKEVLEEDGKVAGVVFKKCIRVLDEQGRFSPEYDEEQTVTIPCKHVIFSVGQAIEWGNMLDNLDLKRRPNGGALADKLTYQTSEPDIFVGGDVYTGPRFAIDAIAAGREGAISLHRYVHENCTLTIGRNRRDFVELDKNNISVESYDTSKRQIPAKADEKAQAATFRDLSHSLTEEQVKAETSRCLSCGASVVDPNKCIGCGVCTTKCVFDAIHLHREIPGASVMRASEDKLKYILPNMVKQSIKVKFAKKK